MAEKKVTELKERTPKEYLGVETLWSDPEYKRCHDLLSERIPVYLKENVQDEGDLAGLDADERKIIKSLRAKKAIAELPARIVGWLIQEGFLKKEIIQ